MAAPKTRITRACESAGITYKVGDVIKDPHLAERFVLLGFAESGSTSSADSGNSKEIK